MKTLSVIFPLSLLAMSAPAVADPGLSLSRGVKLCKGELAKLDPPPKSHRVDYDDTFASETHFNIAINARLADGRVTKLTCNLDRQAGIAKLVFKYPGDTPAAAPALANQ
jgi:hypothetical protein